MEAALDCLDAEASDVRILQEARRVISPGTEKHKDLISKYGEKDFKRIEDFIASSKEVKPGSRDEQSLLLNIPGIDWGEAVLLTSTIQYDDFTIITGDKRCLSALRKQKGLDPLKKRIKGRCFCYEQVFLEILECYGVEYIQSRFFQICKTDITFDKEFYGGRSFRKGSFISILNNKITEITEIAGDIMGDFTS